jgi:hypothetical protein
MALTIIFGVVSLFSVFFIVRRYRTATPAQQRQIIFAAAGAAAVALLLFCLFTFR